VLQEEIPMQARLGSGQTFSIFMASHVFCPTSSLCGVCSRRLPAHALLCTHCAAHMPPWAPSCCKRARLEQECGNMLTCSMWELPQLVVTCTCNVLHSMRYTRIFSCCHAPGHTATTPCSMLYVNRHHSPVVCVQFELIAAQPCHVSHQLHR
jgi:hypothetical protein